MAEKTLGNLTLKDLDEKGEYIQGMRGFDSQGRRLPGDRGPGKYALKHSGPDSKLYKSNKKNQQEFGKNLDALDAIHKKIKDSIQAKLDKGISTFTKNAIDKSYEKKVEALLEDKIRKSAPLRAKFEKLTKEKEANLSANIDRHDATQYNELISVSGNARREAMAQFVKNYKRDNLVDPTPESVKLKAEATAEIAVKSASIRKSVLGELSKNPDPKVTKLLKEYNKKAADVKGSLDKIIKDQKEDDKIFEKSLKAQEEARKNREEAALRRKEAFEKATPRMLKEHEERMRSLAKPHKNALLNLDLDQQKKDSVQKKSIMDRFAGLFKRSEKSKDITPLSTPRSRSSSKGSELGK